MIMRPSAIFMSPGVFAAQQAQSADPVVLETWRLLDVERRDLRWIYALKHEQPVASSWESKESKKRRIATKGRGRAFDYTLSSTFSTSPEASYTDCTMSDKPRPHRCGLYPYEAIFFHPSWAKTLARTTR